LVRLLPDYETPEIEMNALYPHRRHMSAKVRVFIDTLIDHFARERRRLDSIGTGEQRLIRAGHPSGRSRGDFYAGSVAQMDQLSLGAGALTGLAAELLASHRLGDT
jgi:hypothetical protein